MVDTRNSSVTREWEKRPPTADTPLEVLPTAAPKRNGRPIKYPEAPGQAPLSPYEDLRNKANLDYRSTNMGYNPYTTSAGTRMQGMNFNPYRSAAVNAAQSQAGNQLVSQQSQLQQTGGLSSADRMRAFSDFNRQKILGQLGGVQQINQAQSQNLMDVGRYNTGRDFDVQRTNVLAQNDANRDLAQANLRRDQNLYQTGINDRNLDRQLEAAKLIAQGQMDGKVADLFGFNRMMSDPLGSYVDFQKKLFDPLNVTKTSGTEILNKVGIKL